MLPGFLEGQQVADLPVHLVSQSDGLRERDNRFIFHDTEGFTWISSVHGLYRFDGKYLKNYLPDEKDSTSLRGYFVNGRYVEDSHHDIWLTTYEGLNCYRRNSDSFQSFTIPGYKDSGYYLGGADSLYHLWMLFDTLLVTFNMESHQFSTIGTIGSGLSRLIISLNSRGEIQRAYAYNTERTLKGFHLFKFDNGKIIRQDSFFTNTSSAPYVIRNIYVENDSSLWIASNMGLIHFNPENKAFCIYAHDVTLDKVNYNNVERMNDSLLLIVSYSKGAFTFNTREFVFQDHFQLNENGKVIKEPLQTIYRDRNGGMWISITGLGVAYFHPSQLRMKYYPHELSTTLSTSGINANGILQMNNSLVWISSGSNGAAILNANNEIIQSYNMDVSKGWIANNTLGAFMDSDDRIWTLTASGPVIREMNGHVYPLMKGKVFGVNSMCEIQKNKFLLSISNQGLFSCTLSAQQNFDIELIKEQPHSFYLLHFHEDGLVYAPADLTTLEIMDPENGFRSRQSIPFTSYATCMVGMNGGKEIWMGSNDGVHIFNVQKKTFTNDPRFDFLFNIMVCGIVPVGDSMIWFSTNNGIYAYYLHSQKVKWFQMANGTGTLNFIPNSFLKKDDGKIWFGSQNGITAIEPDPWVVSLPELQIHFSRILVNDEEDAQLVCANSGATNISSIRKIKLPFTSNTLSFEFVAWDYAGQEDVLYEYRMSGMEEKWIPGDRGGSARYAGIRPGDYTMEVRARSKSGSDYSSVRSIDIHIMAPFYMQAWFILAVILIIVGLIYAALLYFQKRKQEIQRLMYEKKLALETERLRIANDMHDDLGSGLSALSLRARLLADQVKSPELISQVEELAGNTDRLAQQIRETIWTVNSKNDTVDSLVTRLHQYAIDYFEGSGTNCQVTLMSEQILSIVPGNHRREIYLAFKEVLHNIQKHAKATVVTISMLVDSADQLSITIKDNGVGFDVTREHNGQGISSMIHRMEEIGGQCRMVSAVNGTTVVLIYPLWD